MLLKVDIFVPVYGRFCLSSKSSPRPSDVGLVSACALRRRLS